MEAGVKVLLLLVLVGAIYVAGATIEVRPPRIFGDQAPVWVVVRTAGQLTAHVAGSTR